MRKLALAAAFVCLPALAQADGFYTSDMGEGGAPEACIARAERSLSAYIRVAQNAGATMATGSWSVDAYHLQPGDVSVQIACPYRDSHVSAALVTAFSTGPETDRIAAVEAIVQRWNAPGQQGDVRDPGSPGK